MFARFVFLVSLFTAALGTPARAAPPHDAPIIVFAAASLKNVLDAVDALFTKQSGIKVVASYVATSAPVKQIENSARVQAFASAVTLGAGEDAARYVEFLRSQESKELCAQFGFTFLAGPG